MDLQQIKQALEAISDELYTGTDQAAKKKLAQLIKDVHQADLDSRVSLAEQDLHAPH